MDKSQSLILQGVSKMYNADKADITVLSNVSWEFKAHASYAIRGVSGSGKSTLLHLLGGLDQPSGGVVLYGDMPLSQLGDSFRQTAIGFMFQYHYLINELPIIENVMLPGLIKGMPFAWCQARAHELLGTVGLSQKATAYPSELSGGQQQRVALARALFNKPLFLLVDEPTGNLDALSATRIIDMMLAAQQEWGMSIILCSHDQAVYNRMDTVLQLASGQLHLEKGIN